MKPEIIIDGLYFPESPRWHNERLWFSDMHGLKVMAVDVKGNSEVIVETKYSPSGLGWLPGGDLMIVSMPDRHLLRYDGHTINEMADLSPLVKYKCNDMVVDRDGYAYIGNFGFDIDAGESPVSTILIGVSPEGEIKEVANDLVFPNGMVISADGKTLVVAESFANRLTAFDIQKDKSLSNKRVWAKLDDYVPDGIAMDIKGGIWVASAMHNLVLRVEEDGIITDKVEVSQTAFACAIGGLINNILFVCTAKSPTPEEALSQKSGRIECLELK